MNALNEVNKVITSVSYYSHRHGPVEEEEWLTAERMAVRVVHYYYHIHNCCFLLHHHHCYHSLLPKDVTSTTFPPFSCKDPLSPLLQLLHLPTFTASSLPHYCLSLFTITDTFPLEVRNHYHYLML